MPLLDARPLTREAFAPFGQVIETEGNAHYLINGGRTERYHAVAQAEAVGEDARVVLSLFRGQPAEMPLRVAMVERHPLGSQAFVPLSPRPFLVVVCPDGPDGPGTPRAFVTRPGQGVNYPRGLWHAVLMPLGETQDFLVVDRAGSGTNVEEFHFPEPHVIRLPEGV